eukprot:jgi/Chrzof1/11183/Cz05g27070.t1
MSSLAAARADNFYYPPEFDPQKHGSLNKFQGQHPLRERAKKMDQGILVIRFEVPYNMWCDQCGEMIAKGVRFNAEKKQVGNYHSTKIWAFSMHHHCGCKITIQTDPKNAEYVVTEGGRQKIEAFTAEDAETIELPDDNERAALSADPLARLERSTLQAQAAASGRAQLLSLAEESELKHKDDYKLNKALRAKLRAAKKEDAKLDERRKSLGLPEHVKLLPAAESDAAQAKLAFYADDHKFQANWKNKRRKVMTESIFSSSKAGSTSALPPKQTVPLLTPKQDLQQRAVASRRRSLAEKAAKQQAQQRHKAGVFAA